MYDNLLSEVVNLKLISLLQLFLSLNCFSLSSSLILTLIFDEMKRLFNISFILKDIVSVENYNETATFPYLELF